MKNDYKYFIMKGKHTTWKFRDSVESITSWVQDYLYEYHIDKARVSEAFKKDLLYLLWGIITVFQGWDERYNLYLVGELWDSYYGVQGREKQTGGEPKDE